MENEIWGRRRAQNNNKNNILIYFFFKPEATDTDSLLNCWVKEA